MELPNKTYVYDNRALANEAMKSAPPDACALGVRRTTAVDLVTSLWELWGDGRRIVGGTDRTILVYSLLGKHGMQPSLGAATQISSFIGKCLYSLEKASFCCASLPERGQAVLDVAEEYSRLIISRGLVELSEVAEAVKGRLSAGGFICEGEVVVDAPLHGLFAGASGESSLHHESLFDQACKDVGFAMLLPEGRSVVGKMVLDEALRGVSEGMESFAIVSEDAWSAFRLLAPSLAEESFGCSLKSRVALRKTLFGRFVLASCRLMSMASMHGFENARDDGESDWRPVASDVASSIYARIGTFDADCINHPLPSGTRNSLSWRDMNAIWRSDRLLGPSDASGDLLSASESYAKLCGMFSGGSAEECLGYFEDIARSSFDGVQGIVEVEAVRSVFATLSSLEELDQPATLLPIFAQSASMTVSVLPSESHSEEGKDRPTAYFVDLRYARELYPQTFDEVVLCDVSDESLSSKSQRRSVDVIASEMGIELPSLKERLTSLAFSSCVLAARKTFACVYPKHGADSAETFPSYCIEGFFEKRFEGSLAFKDVVSCKPGFLDVAVAGNRAIRPVRIECLGEGGLVESVGRELALPKAFEEFPLSCSGELSYSRLPGRMRHAMTESGQLPCMSPSAIEAYLGCPYKWFIERIVQPKSPDEGLGPVECGNFAHEALELFYKRLSEGFGATNVSGIPEEAVGEIADDVLSEVLEAQYLMPPSSGRYVPSTPSELASASQLETDIKQSIMLEGSFPKRFETVAREYAIPEGDGSLHPCYAGFALVGRVDRIDADEGSGAFAVIDYKGSISSYDAGERTVVLGSGEGGAFIDPESLPGHVQALVYAKAIADGAAFGDKCDAAFYTSYRAAKAKCLAVGSYKADDEGLAAVSDKKSAVEMPMDRFLGLIEEAVSSRISPIYDSEISPEPSGAAACRYCPVRFCAGGL